LVPAAPIEFVALAVSFVDTFFRVGHPILKMQAGPLKAGIP
jgi:hypothetical protein